MLTEYNTYTGVEYARPEPHSGGLRALIRLPVQSGVTRLVRVRRLNSVFNMRGTSDPWAGPRAPAKLARNGPAAPTGVEGHSDERSAWV